jgi:hypothetical protein
MRRPREEFREFMEGTHDELPMRSVGGKTGQVRLRTGKGVITE